MSGISRMILRSSARNRDDFACPMAMKVCWQPVYRPISRTVAK